MRALGGLAAVAAAAVAILLFVTRDDGPDPLDAAERYALRWTRGDDAGAARLTDRPAVARVALVASREGLDGATVRVSVNDVTEDADGERATARLDVRWEVPAIGPFRYSTTLRLRRGEQAWTVVWEPASLHPDLTGTTRLGTDVDAPERAPIRDRRGRELLGNRDVVDLAVEVDEAAPDTVARLAALIDDVDRRPLARAVRQAPAGRFVPVITLRTADYTPIAGALEDVPGVSIAGGVRPLAPSRDFARALLGTVGPATAEQIEESDRQLVAGDLVGQSGLSAAYDAQLAGEASRSVVTRDVETEEELSTLAEVGGADPQPLRTTLDLRVQRAAERALDGVDGNAALVAMEASSGNVLAVANRPADSTYDRALSGTYPPGSTFKVVSTAALLRDGLDVDETVDCPPTITVAGRPFRNFEGGAAGAVPFVEDFATSCNTAFVSLSNRLPTPALPRVARDFGLGREVEPGAPAGRSSVPAADSASAQAAMMIGQDRILASPLAMAGVAGTVAAGRWHAPRLVADAPRTRGPRLPGDDVRTLRRLMRLVVTSGTGTALADVAGEPHGKSGTAEYGSGDPLPTHAWFIAYRGDLAVSVLVEDGVAGGRVAAPLAAAFFNALD